MAKKVLFCASTVSHIVNFHLPYLRLFREWGFEVHIAAEREAEIQYADKVFAFPFCKSLTSFANIKAVSLMKKLILRENYTLVVTNTTLVGAIARMAVRLAKKPRPSVLHICHGYLFNRDGGAKKWFYLLAEKVCAAVTDVLVVMNGEDEYIARKHRLFRGELKYTFGMGVDPSRFVPFGERERRAGRAGLGFSDEDFVFVYAADFSARKNQKELIAGFAEAFAESSGVYLLLAGDGATRFECEALAEKLGVGERVRFLGHVKGMERLYPLCDAAASSSLIEGLPFNIMEAMCCGLPVVASDVKGNRELVGGSEFGVLYRSRGELAGALRDMAARRPLAGWGVRLERYCIDSVFPEMEKIYSQWRF